MSNLCVFLQAAQIRGSIRTSTRSNCVIHYGCINFVTHAQFGVRSGLMTARDPKMSHDTGKQ